jgi:hypothetical protein
MVSIIDFIITQILLNPLRACLKIELNYTIGVKCAFKIDMTPETRKIYYQIFEVDVANYPIVEMI